MDFYNGGDMLTMLSKFDERVPEKVVKFYLTEIILALDFLHQLGYVHRDIKPDNILLDQNGHIVLADFGSCLKIDEDGLVRNSTPVGTPDYISPEILRATENGQGTFGKECDYWSLGVVMYELLFGETPFYSENLVETYRQIMNFQQFLKLPEDDEEISSAARNLIGKLICDRKQRLGRRGIIDFKEHEFFADIDWENIRNTVAPYSPEVNSPEDTSNFDIEHTSRVHEGPPIGKVFKGCQVACIGFTFTKDIYNEGSLASLELPKNLALSSPTRSVNSPPISSSSPNGQNKSDEKLETLNSKCFSLKSKIEELESTLSTKNEEISVLCGTLSDLQARLDEMDNMKPTSVNGEETTKENVVSRSLTLVREVDTWQAKYFEAVETTAAHSETITKLEKSLTENREMKNELSIKLETLKDEKDSLISQLIQAQALISQLESTKHSLLSDLNAARRDVVTSREQSQDQIAQLNEKIVQLEAWQKAQTNAEGPDTSTKATETLTPSNEASHQTPIVDTQKYENLMSENKQLMEKVRSISLELEDTSSSFKESREHTIQLEHRILAWEQKLQLFNQWADDEKASKLKLQTFTQQLVNELKNLKDQSNLSFSYIQDDQNASKMVQRNPTINRLSQDKSFNDTSLNLSDSPSVINGLTNGTLDWRQRKSQKQAKLELCNLQMALKNELRAREEAESKLYSTNLSLNQTKGLLDLQNQRVTEQEQTINHLRDQLTKVFNQSRFPSSTTRPSQNNNNNEPPSMTAMNESSTFFQKPQRERMNDVRENNNVSPNIYSNQELDSHPHHHHKEKKDSDPIYNNDEMPNLNDSPTGTFAKTNSGQMKRNNNNNMNLSGNPSGNNWSSSRRSIQSSSTTTTSSNGGLSNLQSITQSSSGPSTNPHKFTLVNLSTPKRCGFCHQLMLGQKNQGVRCVDCNLEIHPKCRQNTQGHMMLNNCQPGRPLNMMVSCFMPSPTHRNSSSHYSNNHHLQHHNQNFDNVSLEFLDNYEDVIFLPKSKGIKRGWTKYYMILSEDRLFVYDILSEDSLSNSQSGNLQRGQSSYESLTQSSMVLTTSPGGCHSPAVGTLNSVHARSTMNRQMLPSKSLTLSLAPVLIFDPSSPGFMVRSVNHSEVIHAKKNTVDQIMMIYPDNFAGSGPVFILFDRIDIKEKWISRLQSLIRQAVPQKYLIMHEIVSAENNFPKQILSACVLDENRVLLGSEDGLHLVDIKNDTLSRVGEKKVTYQIEALDNTQQIVIVIQEKSRQLKLILYRSLEGLQSDPIRLSDSKMCQNFICGYSHLERLGNISPNSTTLPFLLISSIIKSPKVIIYEIARIQGRHRKIKEVIAPDIVQSINFLRSNTFFIIGCNNYFGIYSPWSDQAPQIILKTDLIDLDISLVQLKSQTCTPIMCIEVVNNDPTNNNDYNNSSYYENHGQNAVISGSGFLTDRDRLQQHQQQNEEFLVVFQDFGLYIDSNRKRSRSSDIHWPAKPLHFAYRKPYLLIFCSDFHSCNSSSSLIQGYSSGPCGIMIFNVITSEWITSLTNRRAIPLCNDGHLLLSSNGNGETENVMRLLHMTTTDISSRIIDSQRLPQNQASSEILWQCRDIDKSQNSFNLHDSSKSDLNKSRRSSRFPWKARGGPDDDQSQTNIDQFVLNSGDKSDSNLNLRVLPNLPKIFNTSSTSGPSSTLISGPTNFRHVSHLGPESSGNLIDLQAPNTNQDYTNRNSSGTPRLTQNSADRSNQRDYFQSKLNYSQNGRVHSNDKLPPLPNLSIHANFIDDTIDEQFNISNFTHEPKDNRNFMSKFDHSMKKNISDVTLFKDSSINLNRSSLDLKFYDEESCIPNHQHSLSDSKTTFSTTCQDNVKKRIDTSTSRSSQVDGKVSLQDQLINFLYTIDHDPQ